jgi:lysophospholipase
MRGFGPIEGLVAIPGINLLPEGAEHHMVTTPDGVRLRAARWRGGERGTVVILNGRGDYIERYFETVHELRQRGLSVTAFDFRGQGGSQRPFNNRYRSAVASFQRYEDDLAAVMNALVLPDCPPPYTLLAHSTGALIALTALWRHSWFSKAILTSPLLGFHTGAWPLSVARALAHLVPALGGGAAFLPGYTRRPLVLSGFADNPLTSCKRRFERDVQLLLAAPSLGLGGPSFSWLRAAFLHMGRVRRISRKRPVGAPTLIVAAGADRVVDSEAARQFARQAGIAFVEIRDAQHEILMEREPIRAAFFAAFDSFVLNA